MARPAAGAAGQGCPECHAAPLPVAPCPAPFVLQSGSSPGNPAHTLSRSSSSTPLAQRLALAVSRLGTGSAWLFRLSVGLVVALGVTGLLVMLDGMAWPSALLAGLLALVPALAAGAVALHLARALLLIDTDHLKRINDSLGLRCGDAILLEVTRRVGATLRQSDVLARFGGAELAVFLPHTDPLGALDAAERIRQQVASAPMRWEDTHLVVTVSVGVAHVHTGQPSLDALVHESENALQMAKDAGRNCVRAAPLLPRSNSGETAAPARG